MFSPLQQVYIDNLKSKLERNNLIIPHEIPSEFKDDQYWIDEWNRMHCLSVDLRNEFFADYCERVLTKAKEYYYQTGTTLMSDTRFDSMERSLKLLRPNSKVLQQVGSK